MHAVLSLQFLLNIYFLAKIRHFCKFIINIKTFTLNGWRGEEGQFSFNRERKIFAIPGLQVQREGWGTSVLRAGPCHVLLGPCISGQRWSYLRVRPCVNAGRTVVRTKKTPLLWCRLQPLCYLNMNIMSSSHSCLHCPLQTNVLKYWVK